MNKKILKQQQNELNAHYIYTALAKLADDTHNKTILENIAKDELWHYDFLKNITGASIKQNKGTIKRFITLAKIFGLSFALRLLEKEESQTADYYESIEKDYPDIAKIKDDEIRHEVELIGILKDKRLDYAGAIVLGLNDALVEFTGTLAGLTFAFADNLIVGSTGLIMGIAASLSMAASGYLASREEGNTDTNPITSAIYTGLSYIITVAFLVFPYFIQSDPYIALGAMLLTTVAIIALYTYYISVAKNISFKKRFLEMGAISLGVAILSFGIGLIVKHYFGIAD